jgi:predicted transcriptional regulator
MIKQAEKIELKQITVKHWSGVSKAARRLGVTPTQVSRHVNSEPGDLGYSMKLSRRMKESGITVNK